MTDHFISVYDTDLFSKACFRAARNCRRDFIHEVQDASKIGERAAKSSAATVRLQAAPPTHHRHRPGIREHPNLNSLLVAGIRRRDTNYGAEIVQEHGGLTGKNDDKLPAAINRGVWRHPVFGNRRASFVQTATPMHYFTGAINAVERPMTLRAADVIDTIVRRLE